MSYFGQVRSNFDGSIGSLNPSRPGGISLLTEQLAQREKLLLSAAKSHHSSPDLSRAAEACLQQPLAGQKRLATSHTAPASDLSTALSSLAPSAPYPTPPISRPPSLCDAGVVRRSSVVRGGVHRAHSIPRTSPAGCSQSTGCSNPVQSHFTICSKSISPVPQNQGAAGASHDISVPELVRTVTGTAAAAAATAAEQLPLAAPPVVPTPGKWTLLHGLRELTRGVIFKSGTSTPTRALSAAQPSKSEGAQSSGRNSHDDGSASGTQTPRGPSGAQAPAPKGRLTIKITEARGLRKCRDPYVVVVFQRSELISGGPRPGENEEPLNAAATAMGGIPIQRQGSDSGRTPMAIPMRSRQSSNTSISDYNTFRNRPRRQSFTNPTWDAEAVL